MNKFFLMTRGRTGSTAVIDELDKSSGIRATQELFLKYNFEPGDGSIVYYNIAPPFDLWKAENIWRKWLPASIYTEAAKANRYLKEVETVAANQGSKSFGFKVLSFHFTERPFLSQLLTRREYSTIYLTRNLARQVLSGMVASKTGLYSTQKDVENSERYEIDLDEFQWMVEWEKKSVENDLVT